MDTVSWDGLCLRAIDYKDRDKLITLYCAEKGKITATVKGVKSPKAKLKFCASPLCFGKYYMSAKAGRYTVTGCDAYDTFFDVSCDILKYYCACCIIEVLDRFSPEGEYNGQLFTTALKALNTVCYKEDVFCTTALKDFFGDALEACGYGKTDMSIRQYAVYFANKLEVKINSLSELIRLL